MTLATHATSEGVPPNEAGPSVGTPLPKPPLLVRLWRKYTNTIIGIIVVLAALSIWEWAAYSGAVNPLFSSSPSRIVGAYGELIATGQLAEDTAASSRVFLVGFGLSVATGIPIGFLMGWYRPIQAVLNPFVNFFNVTPRIALLPLFLIWFGIGLGSKVAVVYLGAVFPILINALGGIRSLDPTVLHAARSFGASDIQVFRTVALPGSVPFILSGLRLGLALALTGTVVAELYAATSGVGFLIAISGARFQTDQMFVGITIVAIAGVVFTAIILRIERHFQSWKPQAR